MRWLRGAMMAAVLALSLQAQAGAFKQVYVDDAGVVHLVTAAGKDMRMAGKATADTAQLAADGNSAVWQAADNEIRLYRRGKTRSIKCDPFIREFWFWKNGSRIAIDCGGSHFAGREILYDSFTLKQLESFDQAEVPTEKRPEWSSSSDLYKPD